MAPLCRSNFTVATIPLISRIVRGLTFDAISLTFLWIRIVPSVRLVPERTGRSDLSLGSADGDKAGSTTAYSSTEGPYDVEMDFSLALRVRAGDGDLHCDPRASAGPTAASATNDNAMEFPWDSPGAQQDQREHIQSPWQF